VGWGVGKGDERKCERNFSPDLSVFVELKIFVINIFLILKVLK